MRPGDFDVYQTCLGQQEITVHVVRLKASGKTKTLVFEPTNNRRSCQCPGGVSYCKTVVSRAATGTSTLFTCAFLSNSSL